MFTKCSDSLTAKLESLVEKSTKLTEAVSMVAAVLDHKIKQLEQKNSDLAARMDDLENYARLDNLSVYGVITSTSDQILRGRVDSKANS